MGTRGIRLEGGGQNSPHTISFKRHIAGRTPDYCIFHFFPTFTMGTPISSEVLSA